MKEMTGISRVTTEKAEIKLLQNRIVKVVIFSNSTIDLQSAKIIAKSIDDMSESGIRATLFDVRKMVNITTDARRYFKNYKKKNVAAIAILIDSAIQKTIIKMLLRLTPPRIVTRVFDDEKSAKIWLRAKIKNSKVKISSDVLS